MEPEQDRIMAKVVEDVTDLLATLRRERDRRRSAGEDTTWLDQVLRELQPLEGEVHDLEIFRAIHAVVARHGPGPYPPEDLAALAGVADVEGLRRVLDQMVRDGLATPPGEPGR